MSETPRISLIVPVYNGEKWLRRCFDSIICQTFQNWECLLVNDGSTDNSGAVCDEYAAKDTRFHVIHQQNGGVSSARNAGIVAARGKYLLFVDNDDVYTTPLALDWIMERQHEHGQDMIVWSATGQQQVELDLEKPQCRLFAKNQLQAYISIATATTVWNKCFLTNVVREKHILYRTELKRCEDYAFCWAYLKAHFDMYPQNHVRVYDLPLYGCLPDNGMERAGNAKIASHPIEWEPEESRHYAACLMEEYRQMLASMNGFEAMTDYERLSICHQYSRRFSFAVWAAHELDETLPVDFFGEDAVGGLSFAMKKYQLYSAYYWPLALKWLWLIRKMYHSDESESKKLYWRVYHIGDLLLGRRWKRM